MITSIKREFNLFPNLVGIVTDDDLTAITTPGYFASQLAFVEALNNGVWQWEPQDLVLIYYATAQIGFFTYDSSTDAFVALPANGGVSNTLPSGDILVGSAGNLATARALSGDATLSNTGVMTIANSAITNAKIAANVVDTSKLALNTIQYAAVPMTAAQFNGMYAAPFLLVAAPGANKLIVVKQLVMEMTFVSAQYANGGVVAAQYDSTVHGAGVPASATVAAATVNGYAASTSNLLNGALSSAAFTTTVNKGLYLSNQTGAFDTGDSTWIMHVWYSIVATV